MKNYLITAILAIVSGVGMINVHATEPMPVPPTDYSLPANSTAEQNQTTPLDKNSSTNTDTTRKTNGSYVKKHQKWAPNNSPERKEAIKKDLENAKDMPPNDEPEKITHRQTY